MSRRTLLIIHLCGAAVAGLFLIVLGVTGAIMAFEDDLDRLANPRLFSSTHGREPLPVATILEKLRAAYPGKRFGRLQLPTHVDDPCIAGMGGQQIFIDSGTGGIIGTRTTPTTLSRIHQLHTSLLAGKTGNVAMGIAAAILAVLLATGAALWWPTKRLGASLRRPTSTGWHHALGVWSLPLLLVLALTGVLVAFGDAVVAEIYAIAGASPPLRDLPSPAPADGAASITPDVAIGSARKALPGAVPLAVSLPGDGRGSYSVAMRFPGDLTPGGRSWVIVDQYRGTALYIEDSRAAPAGAAFATANRALHTGDILGYPSKIAMSLASLALVAQVITGCRMWWLRRRRQAAARI